MRIAAFATILILTGAPVAMAQNTPVPDHETKEVDAPAPVICVHTDPPTGSRIGARKSCHTEAEWRTIHANGVQTLLDMQNRQDNNVEGALLMNGG